MENAIPSWMDDSFLTRVLQSVADTREVEVMEVRCQPAVPPGTNYMSHIYRVSVEYKTTPGGSIQSTALIVKIPLGTGMMKDFFDKLDGYGRELKFYNEILPKMCKLYDSPITPRSFFCPLKNSLVMEDLRVSGYVMKDRLPQLDLPHCRLFLETLARLHALSVAVFHSHPLLIQNIGRHMFFDDEGSDEEMQQKRAMIIGFLTAMSATIEKLAGCDRYATMVRERTDSYWEKIVRDRKRADGLKVLNHGDTWTANIMFKYNASGDVTDVKLVDFQLAVFGSWAMDVLYFWWSSANEEVREHHREELFEVYRLTLNRSLRELNCRESVSKDDFDLEMKIVAPFSIFVISGMLPFALSDPEDLLDLDSFSPDELCKEISEDSPQSKYFRSKYYRAALPKVLRQVEDFGAFQ